MWTFTHRPSNRVAVVATTPNEQRALWQLTNFVEDPEWEGEMTLLVPEEDLPVVMREVGIDRVRH